YVNLSAKGRLEKALIPKQWFRVLRNGKDIGYVYAVEEVAEGIPGDDGASRRKKKGAAGAPGVLIGARTRRLAGEEGRVDEESWLFCALDRRTEEWSTIQLA